MSAGPLERTGVLDGGVDLARPAHLVLKADWPVALCGAIVSDRLGTAAAGRDRCPACLKIAQERGLGRPGWTK
jgi:hypothetical protein